LPIALILNVFNNQNNLSFLRYWLNHKMCNAKSFFSPLSLNYVAVQVFVIPASRAIHTVNPTNPNPLTKANAVMCCSALTGSANPIGTNSTRACNAPNAMHAHEYALADCV
jgi:hypothetical protein